jgi:DNA-binding transcriptional MerR regulator
VTFARVQEIISHRQRRREAEAGTLTSSQVSDKTGVSLRQLQWWDEQGVIRPCQRLHKRMYTEAETRAVGVIAACRERGVSLQQLRRYVLPKINGAKAGDLVLFRVRHEQGSSRVTLCSDDELAVKAALHARVPVILVKIP